MPIIVAILNQKGGVGKTTLCTHLARAFQLRKHQILLVDSDPQGSARDWHAANEKNPVPVVALDRPTLHRDLRKITSGYDWVLIDGAPQVHDLAISAIKIADIVLIPVQPSPYDVWATSELVELIQQRQELASGRPKTSFVISRQIRGTRLAADVQQALDDYGFPVLEGRTTQRVIFAHSAAQGSTALDQEPEGPAAREIQNIANELEEMANG